MRIEMIKDVLRCVALVIAVLTAGVTATRGVAFALGAMQPCQQGYRGATPGSCTRPLPVTSASQYPRT
jgi:hypothetical protein